MAKYKKIDKVPLDAIDLRFDRNVREHTVEKLDSPSMRDSLSLIGQQTIAKVLKVGDRYELIQGNRRTFNMKELRKAGVIDPKTVKRDENGELLRDDKGNLIGGKVFETLEAEVYENISERERMEMVVDSGDVLLLNKVECFFAAEMLLAAGETEAETVTFLGDLFKKHYPPTRKIVPVAEDKGKDLAEYYRGVVQTMKQAWKAPVVVRDAWVAKLRDGLKFPGKKEVAEANKIFQKELEADKTGNLSRKNPGPKFWEYWNKVLESQAKAAEEGKTKGKAVSMMGREQVKEKLPVCDSRSLKAAFRIVLREGIDESQLAPLDKGLAGLESGEITTAQFKDILDGIFSSVPEEKAGE